MDTMKNKNFKDLAEAGEVKVAMIHRTVWPVLNDPDNHDGVVTHLEVAILECEV